MKLNRHNYEEYFILYMDNELGSDDRGEVELFVQQNPDLKAELDMLLQSKFTPDTEVTFADKGSLMMFGSAPLNMTNYEEWLLSYVDDELTAEERKEVEQFIADKPALQKELSLFQKTKLQREAVVFPGKESLYRSTEKAKVITISWKRIAVAAVLLIAVATAVFFAINNKSVNKNDGIAREEKNVTPVNNIPVDDKKVTPEQQSQNINPDNKEKVADNTPKKVDALIKDEPKNASVRKKKDNSRDVNNESSTKQDSKEETGIAQGKTNDLPKPVQNPNVNANEPKKVEQQVIAKNDPPSPEIINDPNKIPTKDVVTTAGIQPSDIAEQPKSNNKGIRGFLRKVTRTFEKRTNIKATDDDDRLLIAGLSIKLN